MSGSFGNDDKSAWLDSGSSGAEPVVGCEPAPCPHSSADAARRAATAIVSGVAAAT
jgi:hypothetical protein